jgi:mannose-1-phosphate guanylyltransferase
VQAIILVGGEGTRLRPLTWHQPKQLLRLLGFPMLERVVDRLAASGVDEVVLSLGYQPDAFVERYPEGRIGTVRVRYAIEREPLDTAGAIRFAAEQGGVHDTFLVVNGDVLTDLDIDALVNFHIDCGGLATIGLVEVEDPSRFGVVVTDEAGRALRFVEKPPRNEAPSHAINAGVYVMEPAAIERVGFGERVSAERRLFPELAAEGSLYAQTQRCYWIDAGTPASYLRAAFDILSGHRSARVPPKASYPAESRPPGGSVCYLGHDVEVAAGSRFAGSVLEDGVSVAEGAHVESSIILEGACLGEGVRVSNSIVGAGTVVPEGVELTELAVVAPSSKLRPGQRLAGSR